MWGGGIIHPLVRGYWVSPQRKKIIFLPFFVHFNWDFYALETRLQIFARKAIIWRMRIPMMDKIYFRQSQFRLFLQHVSLTYSHAGLWQNTLSTNPMVVFMKIYALAPFQLEHPWVCLDFRCATLLDDFPYW